MGDIAASADDQAMLQRLAEAAGVPLERLAGDRFAIWTEPASAAGIVLPIKLPVQTDPGMCVIPGFVPTVRYLVRVVPLAGTKGDRVWRDRVHAEERHSFQLIQQAVGAPVHADQPDTWVNLDAEVGEFTLRRMFRATDAQGHPMRIYRSDAAGNGAYILGVVVETDAQPPEQTQIRIRNAWAAGSLLSICPGSRGLIDSRRSMGRLADGAHRLPSCDTSDDIRTVPTPACRRCSRSG